MAIRMSEDELNKIQARFDKLNKQQYAAQKQANDKKEETNIILSDGIDDTQAKISTKSKKAVDKSVDKPTKKVKARSYLEVKMEQQIKNSILPPFVTEFKPIADRRFRCDFAWPTHKIILEVNGEVHRIKSRFDRDLEKHALLLLDGWTVLCVGSIQVREGQALEWLLRLFAMRSGLQ